MKPRIPLLIAFVGLCVTVMFVHQTGAQSCEATLAALRQASIDLEGRLKRCRIEEQIRCDRSRNNTLHELEREKEVTERLRELLKAKDLERKVKVREIEDEYKLNLADITAERNSLKSQLASATATEEAVRALRDELREEKKKTSVMTTSLEDCKENGARKLNDEVSKLNEQLSDQTSKIEGYKETLEARDAEVESLRRLVTRLEEQKKAGFLEWLQKPNSLESLLEARNITMNLLSPGLDATEKRLLEIREMSTEKFSNVIGMDPETSALISGLLAWGILLIPFFLSFCLLVRVRLSLSKMVLWASLYASLFCLVLFGVSLTLGDEALLTLRGLSLLSHDILLIIFMLGHLLLIVSITLLTLKQWLVTDLGSLRLRHMLQVAIPMFIVVHFYYHYYFIALNAQDEGDTSKDFDERYWFVYSIAYFIVCALVVLGNYSTGGKGSSHGGPSSKAPSAVVVKAGDVVSNIVNAVEGTKEEPDHDHDVESGLHSPNLGSPRDGSSTSILDPSGQLGGGEVKSKKKKKKSRSEHDGDGSTLEVLGPSDVLNAVLSSGGNKKTAHKGD